VWNYKGSVHKANFLLNFGLIVHWTSFLVCLIQGIIKYDPITFIIPISYSLRNDIETGFCRSASVFVCQYQSPNVSYSLRTYFRRYIILNIFIAFKLNISLSRPQIKNTVKIYKQITFLAFPKSGTGWQPVWNSFIPPYNSIIFLFLLFLRPFYLSNISPLFFTSLLHSCLRNSCFLH